MKTLTKIGLTGLLVASLGIGAAQAIPPAPRVVPVARVRAPIAPRAHFAPRAYWRGWYYTPGVSVDFYNPYYVPAPAPAVTVDLGYAPGYYYAPYGFQYAPTPVPFRAGFVPRPYRTGPVRFAPGHRAFVARTLPRR